MATCCFDVFSRLRVNKPVVKADITSKSSGACSSGSSAIVISNIEKNNSATSVNDLIAANRESIGNLRKRLLESSPSDYSEGDDDLVLLRYVLSNPDGDQAYETFLKAKQYRKQHAHVFEKAHAGESLPSSSKFYGKMPSGLWDYPMANGNTVWIVRIGFCDNNIISREEDQDDLLYDIIYSKERSFLLLDKLTRETGRLVKGYTILDFHNLSIFGKQPPGTAEASKISEFLYPQMAAKTIMINMPWFFSALFNIVKHVMPAKVLEKIAMCPATDTASAAKNDICRCPFLQKEWPDTSKIPDFLGGSCPVSKDSMLFV